MENTEKEKFESLWNNFSTLVKGKLITTAQQQTLTTPLAKLILSEAASTWSDEYSIYGRWLNQMMQNDNAKASLIKDILLNDMTFNDVEVPKVLPDYCNYLIPGIGACAGYALSYYLNFGKMAQAAAILLPAVLLYPAVKKIRNNQAETAIDKVVSAYMNQLEKIKNSVIAILS